MGQVYRARDARLAREVALKVVHAELARDAERLRRFEHEARAAGVLNHPNIVAVYDTGQSDGSPYIVSELLQGETLRNRLSRGVLGVRKAVDYGVQIARGLSAAHEKGIVHRDLKPENLFLTKDGLVKILDFGVAKLGHPDEEPAGTDIETLSHTTPGTILGTVGYMSPEQVRGLAADHRSDLFSFGAVMFEMLTGRKAFTGTTPADTLSGILREDPTETLRTAYSVPPGLLRVVRRCLEKMPEDRFQTARDLAFALEGVTGEPTSPSGEWKAVHREPRVVRRRWARPAAVALGVLLPAAAVGLWAARRPVRPVEPPTFQRLTFRLGDLISARFAPDQETILYSAEWGGRPMEVFSTRSTARGSRPLGIRDARLLSISAKEELALLLHPRIVGLWIHQGTLARAPLAGGSPREVLDDVIDADWSPDGTDLAVIHVADDGHSRIEFPIGRVLYDPEPPTWLSTLRVSTGGHGIVFFEHKVANDNQGDVRLIDARGSVSTLSAGYSALNGLAWAGDAPEVRFTAARTGGSPQQLYGMTLGGSGRVLVAVGGLLHLVDASRSGRALFRRGTTWTETHARRKGAPEETELAAADLSSLVDLSDDGQIVLGADAGDGSGPNGSFYVQKTDGSEAVWLGEGDGQALSPDGRFALAVISRTTPQQLLVVPTGAGEAKVLPPGPVVHYQRAAWAPSGREVLFAGAERERAMRLYVQDLAAGLPRAVTPERVELLRAGKPVSPDGRRVVAIGADGVPALYPLAGGDPLSVPGLAETDIPLCWTTDGRELIVARYESSPPRVERVEVATGRTRPWTGLRRSRPSGLLGDYRVLVTPDGAAYAYSYFRSMTDLYLVTGLK
jgi:tRNA A-37 threonylcarbamoyl transferase component Bud32